MTGTLKAFGLVLFVALAMGGVATHTASAHEFTSEAESYVLTGTNEVSTKVKFTIIGKSLFTFECTDIELEGTQTGKVRDTITVHPKFTSCHIPLASTIPATIDTGGCNYVFDSDTTKGTHFASEEHATTSIECEDAHAIKVTTAGCTAEIGATHPAGTVVNQSLHGVTYSNLDSHSGTDAVTMKITMPTIRSIATGPNCALLGIRDGTHNGSYEGVATFTAYAENTEVSGNTTSGRVWSHGAQLDFTVE